MSVLIVAGHHRSGTSMLARILHHGGLFLGDDLMPGGPSNPHGHFEDLEIVGIHETILADNGHDWQLDRHLIPVVNEDLWRRMEDLISDRQQRFDVWGFKDPRVSLFLPLWKHLLPDCRVIAVFRHPSSCVESLRRRAVRSLHDGTAPVEQVRSLFDDPDLALRLWAVSNRALLRAAAAYGSDVLLVDHTELVSGAPVTDVIHRRWSLKLETAAAQTMVDTTAISATVTPLGCRDECLRREVDAVWSELAKRATSLVDARPEPTEVAASLPGGSIPT